MNKSFNSPPTYRIELTRSARKQLLKLPEKAQLALSLAIDALQKEPRPFGVKKLKGSPDYRIRVGDYRVQYSIFDKVLLIEIIKIGQRGNFYAE